MLKGNYFKHVFTYMLGILFIGAVISYFLYLFLISYQKEEIYKKNLQFAKYEIKQNKTIIHNTIKRYKDILLSLNSTIEKNNLLKSNLTLLKKHMDILIKANSSIFQIRYIDSLGNEKIRIDRDLNKTIFEPKKLQNKSNRYYFLQTKKLKKDEFFISSLDLNVENKKIEIPFRPTLRVSTPIYLNNIFEGILIINFNAKQLIKKVTNSKLFDIYYMDKDKNFLIHPNEDKSWSTQLGTNYKVKDEISNIDSLIKSKKNDTKNRFYIEKIFPEKNTYIILSIKKRFYDASIRETRKDILSLFFIVALIGFPFTLIIAYIQARHVILLDYIVNSIPHPFFIKDQDGKFVIVNDEMLKLYKLKSKKQLIGKNSYNILNQVSLNSKDKDQLALEQGRLKTIEKFYLNDERRYYYEMIRVKIPFYNLFKKTYLLCIAIDITEIQELNTQLNKKVEKEVNSRIKTEQILSQQSKMALMGEMIGNIAHQWRQPLSNITTASTGMKLQKQMHILKEDELIQGLTHINNSAQYLSQTIDDFRNFFKPYKVKTNFTIDFIIQKALKLVSAQFKNKNIKIIKDIEYTKIYNLENEFTQVILNILNNSRDELEKLDSQEKLIFILSKKLENDVIIQIKDNAGGISKKIEKKLYEPYFTTKDEQKGTGIGLYMSKQIIEKHMGGKLSHKNETFTYENKEYKGAVFTIKLKLNEGLENEKNI